MPSGPSAPAPCPARRALRLLALQLLSGRPFLRATLQDVATPLPVLIRPSVDIRGCSHLSAIMNDAATNMGVPVSVRKFCVVTGVLVTQVNELVQNSLTDHQ